MRVNEQTKSMDIESRDINYILPAYVRLYLFQTKNVDPEKIIFPMFREVPHPFKSGVMIPIEFVPDDSPVAIEIKQDGNSIPEATPKSEAEADKVERNYDTMKKRIRELEDEVKKAREQEAEPNIDVEDIKPTASAAKAAFATTESAIAGVDEAHQPTADRAASAKMPSGPILPPGSMSDYGGKRDAGDLRQVAKDLKPEKEINEDEEKEDNTLVKRVKGSKTKEK